MNCTYCDTKKYFPRRNCSDCYKCNNPEDPNNFDLYSNLTCGFCRFCNKEMYFECVKCTRCESCFNSESSPNPYGIKG